MQAIINENQRTTEEGIKSTTERGQAERDRHGKLQDKLARAAQENVYDMVADDPEVVLRLRVFLLPFYFFFICHNFRGIIGQCAYNVHFSPPAVARQRAGRPLPLHR